MYNQQDCELIFNVLIKMSNFLTVFPQISFMKNWGQNYALVHIFPADHTTLKIKHMPNKRADSRISSKVIRYISSYTLLWTCAVEHVITINIDFQMKILQTLVLVTINTKFTRDLLLWKHEKCQFIKDI